MRIVVALGGNALLRRGQPMTAENQRANVRVAAEALAPIAQEHELVISHGNGPQVGLLALQGAAYKEVETYPLDVLGAQTEGMIGYLIEQELGNLLPFEKPFATVLTMVEVDPDDGAFNDPDKFIGPVYERTEADRLAKEKGWTIKQDGDKWRRVVPSPDAQAASSRSGRSSGCSSVVRSSSAPAAAASRRCTSSGTKRLVGAEVVVDKDRASALLARELEADLFVMATDVDGVYLDFGTPQQRRLGQVTTSELGGQGFAAGSMGPKVEAAIDFAQRTGKRAAIGTLAEIGGVVAGTQGTSVTRG